MHNRQCTRGAEILGRVRLFNTSPLDMCNACGTWHLFPKPSSGSLNFCPGSDRFARLPGPGTGPSLSLKPDGAGQPLLWRTACERVPRWKSSNLLFGRYERCPRSMAVQINHWRCAGPFLPRHATITSKLGATSRERGQDTHNNFRPDGRTHMRLYHGCATTANHGFDCM